MVQYRYASDASGKLVDAEVLSKLERNDDWQFVCLGCNQQLTAKVHGNRQPHFAHRPDATCCDETYFHQLGKKVFAEEFNKCRESGEPFEIELPYRVGLSVAMRTSPLRSLTQLMPHNATDVTIFVRRGQGTHFRALTATDEDGRT